jgi:Fe2+ or Zn2+ uptake regulation protein
MIVRAFDCAEGEMPSVGRKSRELIETKFSDVTWEHSHVVVDETGNVRTFCIYDAPDEETVRAHGAQLGMHGIVSIDEVAGDVTPADFPAV